LLAALNDFGSGEEFRVDILKHEGWHAFTTNRSKVNIYNFGYSIKEGTTAVAMYEIYGGNANRRSHIASQYIVRVLQEIVGPRDVMQCEFNDDINPILDKLNKLYGNKLDAVKLVNSTDLYSLYHDAFGRKDIDYNPLHMEILKQLYPYEKAKIIQNIEDDVYNSSEQGVRDFVGHVQYVLNVNNSTFELNEENQYLLDVMRLKVEEEVYQAYSLKHDIDFKSLRSANSKPKGSPSTCSRC
jgi:hypothetical protein